MTFGLHVQPQKYKTPPLYQNPTCTYYFRNTFQDLWRDTILCLSLKLFCLELESHLPLLLRLFRCPCVCAIYLVSEFTLNLSLRKRFILTSRWLMYLASCLGTWTLTREGCGRPTTDKRWRRGHDQTGWGCLIGNKGILLEIRESKGNERSGTPVGRRPHLDMEETMFGGRGRRAGPGRYDGGSSRKENWQTGVSVGRGEGVGPARPCESYPEPCSRLLLSGWLLLSPAEKNAPTNQRRAVGGKECGEGGDVWRHTSAACCCRCWREKASARQQVAKLAHVAIPTDDARISRLILATGCVVVPRYVWWWFGFKGASTSKYLSKLNTGKYFLTVISLTNHLL